MNTWIFYVSTQNIIAIINKINDILDSIIFTLATMLGRELHIFNWSTDRSDGYKSSKYWRFMNNNAYPI